MSHRALPLLLAASVVAAHPPPAGAVMDINDRGPVLDAGRFALRITNVGVIGNAFFDRGVSFDPSFEFPRGSGQELLHHAELWVGAAVAGGAHRVSGGPMLEWRPTLAPTDRVRIANAGDPGTRWNVDNDGDGRINEDPLNGVDDDGDGRVDEDFDLPSQQMATAEYTDDRPEAVSYGYPEGEQHQPLGLSVHQEAYAWSRPGMDAIAGLRFVITNHGAQRLRDLRLGLLADLDSRLRSDAAGHLDDRFARLPYTAVIPEPDAFLYALGTPGTWRKHCAIHLEGEAPTVYDSRRNSGLPCAAVIGLTHTTDPLGFLVNDAFPGVRNARESARAPRRDTTFRFFVYAQDLPPGSGGPPLLDAQRWSALAGDYPTAPEGEVHDYSVLVACGPFAYLDPGQSVEFSVALLAASTLDSIPQEAIQARLLQRGSHYNRDPDRPSIAFNIGETGINGHEIALDPPPGVTFDYDPHCPQKFYRDTALVIDPPSPLTLGPSRTADSTYVHGHGIWTDLDCDACSGVDGTDLTHPWSLATLLPPRPRVRASSGDGRVVVEWDDSPEAALAAGRVGDPAFDFEGYKLYRLSDWHRSSLLPPPEQWQRLAVYRNRPEGSDLPLSLITDASLPSDGTDGGFAHHPIGRYRVLDAGLQDGFDYDYVVTSVIRNRHGNLPPSLVEEYESPFAASFADVVTPHLTAQPTGHRVWAVPNPYRDHAAWDRAAIPGDTFTRHIDFLGLPRARSTIRIYTMAGDRVAAVEHDGTGGDGQASWNLISRNGQDVASGVYLFTVDAPGVHEVGRFVVIR